MRLPERGLLVVCAIAAAFALLQTWLGFWRFDIFRAGVDDGIFTQVVLSIGGCFCATAEGGVNHFLVHWSPILLLAYPFAKAFGGAHGLILLQSLAVAATAFPLYFIARTSLDERRAAILTGVAMLYPVLWAQTFTDFHENAFVPAFSAALACALVTRTWRWGMLAAAGLLLVKEDQFVLVAVIGAIVALSSRADRDMRRFGIIIGAAAVAAGLVFFEIVRPSFHSAVPYLSLHFYDWHSPIPTPLGYVGLWSPERLSYVLWALLPLLFLPLGSRLFLLALPGLLEVLASRERITMVFGTHYSMLWSGYVLAAFVATAARLLQQRRLAGTLVTAASAAASLLWLAFNDPMSRGYYLYRKPDANDALLRQALASVPTAASLGSIDEIYAHAASRPNAFPSLKGEYYLTDERLNDPVWLTRDKPLLDAALKSGAYRVLLRHDGILLARKTH